MNRAVDGPDAANALAFDYRDGDRYHYSIDAQTLRANPDGSYANAGIDSRIRIVAQGPEAFGYGYAETADGAPGIDYRFTRGDARSGPIGAATGSTYALADLGLSVAFEGPSEIAADRAIRLAGYGYGDSLFETGASMAAAWNDPVATGRSVLSGLAYANDPANTGAILRGVGHGIAESLRAVGRARDEGRLGDHLSYGIGRMGPDLTIGAASGGSTFVVNRIGRGVAGDVAETALARARRLGLEGEAAVGITGPKVGIAIPDSGRMRFPDRLTTTSLIEVKNVAYQGYTRQLRDYAAFSRENGLGFELYVRDRSHSLGRTNLSEPLAAAIERGEITLKFIPGVR